MAVRTLDSQSRAAAISTLGQFRSLHVAYLAINWWICEKNLCAVIATWLNASQRSRDGTGMNKRWSVKRFEQFQGLDTTLYKTLPFAKFCTYWYRGICYY